MWRSGSIVDLMNMLISTQDKDNLPNLLINKSEQVLAAKLVVHI